MPCRQAYALLGVSFLGVLHHHLEASADEQASASEAGTSDLNRSGGGGTNAGVVLASAEELALFHEDGVNVLEGSVVPTHVSRATPCAISETS